MKVVESLAYENPVTISKYVLAIQMSSKSNKVKLVVMGRRNLSTQMCSFNEP